MDNCKICNNNFQASPDKLILCEHKGGMVHMGCCLAHCSKDYKQPCAHAVAVYVKQVK